MMTDKHEKILENIQQDLSEIEKRENVRIIHCVESGSRAWGFASPDSDYDVRFIYVRPLNYYLKLGKTRDVIEWCLNDVYDINGWDLKKYCQLAYRSNPTAIEWLNSPIVYRTSDMWNEISPVILQYFRMKPALYHYFNMSMHNYQKYLLCDSIHLKKYFYVLRTLLACHWILEQHSAPPMLFDELVNACLPQALKNDVDHLLMIKRNALEMGASKPVPAIQEFIVNNIEALPEIIAHLPVENSYSMDALDDIFYRTVCEK